MDGGGVVVEGVVVGMGEGVVVEGMGEGVVVEGVVVVWGREWWWRGWGRGSGGEEGCTGVWSL